MYLAHVSLYDIPHAVNQLARGMFKTSEAHMGATKHLLPYLALSTDFLITYQQWRLNLAVYFDDNCGNDPGNAKSMSSYIDMLVNDPIGFKMGIRGLTAQSTMEAELVGSALTMTEAVI